MRCGSSGRGCIYLGDSDGAIHAITRQLQAKTVAEAHLKGIVQIHQCRQSACLFTLGVCFELIRSFVYHFMLIINIIHVPKWIYSVLIVLLVILGG